MKPEDDPEARIRQLEQPLADTARASELGGSQPPSDSGYQAYPPPPSGPVPPPPPPPPPTTPQEYGGDYGAGYGAGYGGGLQPPFPGATPRSSSGNRVFWILAAVFVVGILVVVGGIAAYAANRVSRSFVTTLSPTESTSPINSSPPRSTPRSPGPSSTKTRTPSAGPSSSPAPPSGGTIIVSGINENKSVTCNNSQVSVSGVSNKVVITGHCASLTVAGMQNTITVDAADTIDASGLNNQVTYHSGSPKISKSGDGNVVEQG
jgi:hypothetical protein